MIDAKNLFLLLKKNQINFFTGVPDSVLKNFIYILDSNKKKNETHNSSERRQCGRPSCR